ncbi:MAG: DUF779 domain-containing protein [Ilumatobacteraceae bacterium]
MIDSCPRVVATAAALDLLDALVERHGPVLFHQSGGCCDGSAPMCYPRGEFRIGARDVFLGLVGRVDADVRRSTPFYIGADQFEYWQHTRLTVDVVPGRGSGFSLEAPEGVRFLIRSTVFTDAEESALTAAGPVARGPQPDRSIGDGE